MYKEIIKSAAIFSMLFAVSCAGESPETAKARQLYEAAEQAEQTGDIHTAIVCLDSLDTHCKNQTEWIKHSLQLRPKLIITEAKIQIDSLDKVVNTTRLKTDSITQGLTLVSLPSVDGFFVETAAYNPRFTDTTGLSPRVSPAGEFYLVSSLNPAGSAKHNRVALKIGDAEVSTDPVDYDGALNYRINNGEIITFSPSKSKALGQFAFDNRGQAGTLVFYAGDTPKKSIKLSQKQVDGIARMFDYSNLINQGRTASIEIERLNKRIELANQKLQK